MPGIIDLSRRMPLSKINAAKYNYGIIIGLPVKTMLNGYGPGLYAFSFDLMGKNRVKLAGLYAEFIKCDVTHWVTN